MKSFLDLFSLRGYNGVMRKPEWFEALQALESAIDECEPEHVVAALIDRFLEIDKMVIWS